MPVGDFIARAGGDGNREQPIFVDWIDGVVFVVFGILGVAFILAFCLGMSWAGCSTACDARLSCIGSITGLVAFALSVLVPTFKLIVRANIACAHQIFHKQISVRYLTHQLGT
jgi:hypothetical protein